MNKNRTIRRVAGTGEQQAEAYRYWQNLPVGARLSAVWDVSAAAYAFAAAFKGVLLNDARRPQRTIARFNDHGVKYLIVGGYAFGVHAEPRATKDLDIFVRSDEQNATAVFRALAQYGAPLVELTPSDFMDGTTFQIGQTLARINILQHIDGVTLDEAWENRIEGVIDGEMQAAVIARDDLIRNKLATGREQDILDAKNLRSAGKNDPK